MDRRGVLRGEVSNVALITGRSEQALMEEGGLGCSFRVCSSALSAPNGGLKVPARLEHQSLQLLDVVVALSWLAFL